MSAATNTPSIPEVYNLDEAFLEASFKFPDVQSFAKYLLENDLIYFIKFRNTFIKEEIKRLLAPGITQSDIIYRLSQSTFKLNRQASCVSVDTMRSNVYRKEKV